MRGTRRTTVDGVPPPASDDAPLSAAGERPRGLRELDELDAVFGALAHAARRHILQVLSARGGTMTAGELAARFSHSWPTTTRHLGVLVKAGLLRVRREGRERRYVLDRERLGATLRLWLESVGFTVAEQPRPTSVRDAPAPSVWHDRR